MPLGRGPTRAVPPPHQVRAVTASGYFGTYVYAIVIASGAGAFAVGLTIFAVADADGRQMLPGVLALWVTALVGGVVAVVIRTRVRPARARLRAEIAAQWREAMEGAAWRRAHQSVEHQAVEHQNQGERPGSSYPTRSRIRSVHALDTVAMLMCVLVAAGMMLQGRIGYEVDTIMVEPFALTSVGERRDLSPEMESQMFWVTVGSVVALALGITLIAVSQVLRRRVREQERTGLQAALADPTASRPPDDVLERHGTRTGHPVAQLLAGAATSVLTLGLAFILLGTGSLASFTSVQDRGPDIFGSTAMPAAIACAVAVAAIVGAFAWNAYAIGRHADLRGAVAARWPVLPDPEHPRNASDEDAATAERKRWRRGPALTPPGGDASGHD